jgi:hypothetical protein
MEIRNGEFMNKKPILNTFFLVAFTVTLYFSFLINLLIIVRILNPGVITLGYIFIAVVIILYLLYLLLGFPLRNILKANVAEKPAKGETKLRKLFLKLYIVVLFGWFISMIWASLV